MSNDGLQPMPMSPRQSPGEIGSAAVAMLKTRRGRMLAISAVFVVFMVGLMGATHHEKITNKYQELSAQYSSSTWRPHLPSIIAVSPLKPSNRTLELENTGAEIVPSQLKKETPNFHILMSAHEESPEFCKTTMAAAILNYPPPTVLNLNEKFKTAVAREKAHLDAVTMYLNNTKVVNDEDIVLIVDGQDTWFQLPADVIIRQYQNVVAEANKRLAAMYGVLKGGGQKFNQTIVFAAVKQCPEADLACKYAPESPLPENVYGEDTGINMTHSRAKYLDAGLVMGPAKDLRTLYETAITNFELKRSQTATVQSVLATMFGEQQLARGEGKKSSPLRKITQSKWFSWFGGRAGTAPKEQKQNREIHEDLMTANATLQEGTDYEYAMGLDYTNTLFQSVLYPAQDELLAIIHKDKADFSHGAQPTGVNLSIPTALECAKKPFWTPDLSKNDPKPDINRPPFIAPLQMHQDLDELKSRDTTWTELELIQNTYTGAVPALFFGLSTRSTSTTPKSKSRRSLKRDARLPNAETHTKTAPVANLSWTNLWYSGYSRALLRKHFRNLQSPIGFHNAAIGGDNMWDQRGGRGGVWTAGPQEWLPWGEVDGVCGKLHQVLDVFNDGKGVWLHEKEGNAEAQRKKDELEWAAHVLEAQRKDEERKQKEREKKIEAEKLKADATRQRLKAAKEKKEKEEAEKKKKEEEEERKKKEEEQKKKDEENKKKEAEQQKKQAEEANKAKQAEAAEQAEAARTKVQEVQAEKNELEREKQRLAAEQQTAERKKILQAAGSE